MRGSTTTVYFLCVVTVSAAEIPMEHSTWRIIDRAHFTCRWEDLDEDDMVSARKRGCFICIQRVVDPLVIRHSGVSHYTVNHPHHHGTITSSRGRIWNNLYHFTTDHVDQSK